MIILGVDPGSIRTGYGAIDTDGRRHRLLEKGILAPPPPLDLADRLRVIHARVAQLIALRHPPPRPRARPRPGRRAPGGSGGGLGRACLLPRHREGPSHRLRPGGEDPGSVHGRPPLGAARRGRGGRRRGRLGGRALPRPPPPARRGRLLPPPPRGPHGTRLLIRPPPGRPPRP